MYNIINQWILCVPWSSTASLLAIFISWLSMMSDNVDDRVSDSHEESKGPIGDNEDVMDGEGGPTDDLHEGVERSKVGVVTSVGSTENTQFCIWQW